eukprot:4728500-Prymnesium_polylepis.1
MRVGQGTSGVLTAGAPRVGAQGMRASRAGRLAKGTRAITITITIKQYPDSPARALERRCGLRAGHSCVFLPRKVVF